MDVAFGKGVPLDKYDADFLTDIISNPANVALESLRKSIDDYILSLFGSEENVRKYGNDYILETYPIEVETSEDRDRASNQFRVTQKVRIRPKTFEERKADGNS